MKGPITLRLIEVESRNARFVDKATGQPPVPGDCFYAPETRWAQLQLSNEYKKHALQRSPIIVVLPTVNGRGQWWCVDEQAFNGKQGYHGEGWTVTGVLPQITVTPSIQTDEYHGWVKSGVLEPTSDSKC